MKKLIFTPSPHSSQIHLYFSAYPTWCCLLLFPPPPSTVNAAHIFLNVWPSLRHRQSTRGHALNETDSKFSSSYQLLIASWLRMGLGAHLPLSKPELCLSLSLWPSCGVCLDCYKFICATVHCFLTSGHCLWLLESLCPLCWNDPCASGGRVWYRCPDWGWALWSLRSSAPWPVVVFVFIAIYCNKKIPWWLWTDTHILK